jgi:hypothetical protein
MQIGSILIFLEVFVIVIVLVIVNCSCDCCIFILCRLFPVCVVLCDVFRFIVVLFLCDVRYLCVVSYCRTTATG